MYDYPAQLVRPYDGDSFWVLLDQGLRDRAEEELRLLDVRAPELAVLAPELGRPVPVRQPEPMRLPRLGETGGQETKLFVDGWLARCDPTRRWPLLVLTVPNSRREPEERRTFTRYLATVYDIGDRSRCLNADVNAFLAQHPEWPRGQ